MAAIWMRFAERAERQQPVAQLQQQIQFKKLWRLGRLLSGTFLLRAAFRARLKTIRPSERLGGSTVLGAFRDAELVGIAGFAVQQGQKRAHKGVLWGMYVRPAARKAAVGRRLVEAVCNLARQQVELIQLTVVRDNEQARGLYASLGFLSTARRRTL
jgi:ribosomal protein S18 acetylase RimI-like enzyme